MGWRWPRERSYSGAAPRRGQGRDRYQSRIAELPHTDRALTQAGLAATVAAVVATAGDVGLLWAANAARPELGLAPPPAGVLLAGYYFGSDTRSESDTLKAIRTAVVTRKVCGGNRSPRGAATQQVVASVLRTVWQQQRDPLALLVALQHSPRPTVANLRMPGPAPPA